MDPDAPPVINIAPGLKLIECVDLAFTKHMAPLLNELRGVLFPGVA